MFDLVTRPPLEASPHPPMLVLLHGLGADEHDLLGVASELDPRLHVVSLRAPHETGYGGYAWFPIEFLSDGRRLIDEEEAVRSRDALAIALPSLRSEFAPEASRVILAGFSQGAMIVAGLIFAEPELVDAAWLMSGMYLPILDPGTGGKTLPVLQQHGRFDEVLPVSAGRELAQVLRGRGHEIQYTEYPFGHQIDLESLREARDWMAPHVRN